MPYDGAMDQTRKYVQLSRDIIFEGEMLWRLDTQMLHSHTGFEPYAKEWTTFADEPPQLVEPLRIALSHAWLAWTLLRWRDELQLPKEPLSFASPTHLDETLLDYTMRRDPKTGRFDAVTRSSFASPTSGEGSTSSSASSPRTAVEPACATSLTDT